MANIFKLLFSIATCLMCGFVGSLFTKSSIKTWYAHLRKPFFNPPPWIFGPVWSILYVLMGIAAFIVWQGGLERDGVRTALFVFLVQLLLNAIWSPIFFGMKSPIAGFIVIVFLWLAICITIILFYHVSQIASFLLIPYLLWVSFALVLNFAIARMN